MKHARLVTPDERYRTLRRLEGAVMQNIERVKKNALRIVPGVEKLPVAIQKVLAQVYAIIPEEPSEDILLRALRWAFAHIAHRKDMIDPKLSQNQWEKIIRHYLGRNCDSKDV